MNYRILSHINQQYILKWPGMSSLSWALSCALKTLLMKKKSEKRGLSSCSRTCKMFVMSVFIVLLHQSALAKSQQVCLITAYALKMLCGLVPCHICFLWFWCVCICIDLQKKCTKFNVSNIPLCHSCDRLIICVIFCKQLPQQSFINIRVYM